MTPSSTQDEIRQMHFRKVAIETEKIQIEKDLVAQLKELNSTLKVLASAISNRITA
jgi:hypothetical protein